MSYVYFIRGEKTGLVKIGYSKAPERRLTDIQVGSGERVRLILQVPGAPVDERAFHARFRDTRDRGEWFREEGELAKFLRKQRCDRDHLSSATAKLSGNVLRWGYCTDEQQLEELYHFGLADKEIWMLGRGNETLDDALYCFRGRPGNLILASDTRILGATRGAIMDTMAKIERAGIRVFDITHPEDCTTTDLIQRGVKAQAKNRFGGNHRMARRRGAKGGLAKAANEASRRCAKIADDIAKRLCNFRDLTISDCLEILGDGFTRSTVERHYRGAR